MPHTLFKLMHVATEEDMQMIHEMHDTYPQEMCELAQSIVLTWRRPLPLVALYKDHLLTCYPLSPQPKFFQPIGPNPAPIINEILEGGECVVYPIDERVAEQLRARYVVEEPDGEADYIYCRKEVSLLAGRQYKSQRNRIRHCEKTYSVGFRELSCGDAVACERILDKWRTQRGEDSWLDKDCDATRVAINSIGRFGLRGFGIELDNSLAAFAIGEQFTKNTWAAHFARVETFIPGLADVLFYRMVEALDGNIMFVNRAQDLGHPGIRYAKQSWNPSHYIRKFKISTSLKR